ncbi:hypothetical protein EG329_011419 [Mollisiaceae sp. DMI_Dod_QoI]|nr:hypothetical protein EG329_011419 [Helotiales sp. DMI_Dod_QoI]
MPINTTPTNPQTFYGDTLMSVPELSASYNTLKDGLKDPFRLISISPWKRETETFQQSIRSLGLM